MDGEAKATLNAHINTIKVHHSVKGSAESVVANTAPAALTETLDNLPF